MGRYLITEEIASGGMATVYKAKLKGVQGFEKDVAIKKILPAWSQEKEFIDMLIDEAKVLVHLQHANIVQIFELAKYRENYFIAMEFVDGINLRRLIQIINQNKTKIPLSIACFIIKEVCTGLEFAHSKKNDRGESLNIVHRDISPQNILISYDGQVKITDFGIARIKGRSTETACGTLKGKFSYMSPEQATVSLVDHRSDLYSLALVFSELLTGKKYYDGSHDFAILEKVKESRIKFSQLIPNEVKPLLKFALQKDPNHRYSRIAELRCDIEQLEKDNNLNTTPLQLSDFLSTLLNRKINRISHETKTEIHATTEKIKIIETIANPKTLVTKIIKPKNHIVKTTLSLLLSATFVIFLTAAIFPKNNSTPKIKRITYSNKPDSSQSILDVDSTRFLENLAVDIPIHLYALRRLPENNDLRLPLSNFLLFANFHISARPWGRAYIKSIGRFQTPKSLKLNEGQYDVFVMYPPLNKKIKKKISLKSGEKISCNAMFSEASQLITCK